MNQELSLTIPRPGEPIIEVENLSVQFGALEVLRDVSFQIKRGEIIVVVGGSGCGKTTLLRHIIGLRKPQGGSVRITGLDVHNSSGRQMRELRRNVGMLFQSGALLGSMTLAENVMLPMEDYTRLSRREMGLVANMKLSLVGLSGFQNHLPAEISGGMKKRAGLARAMALDPLVLFFDEPSAGLDPITSAELDELIIKLNKALGTTMVIVSHELASIFSIAHRVIMLDKSVKGIIAEGDPHWLKDNSPTPLVRNFFGRHTGGDAGESAQ